jgi:DNA (cytosine-5)-methyltransferase 1
VRYLSVCSGIEAASVAWHPLGWEPLAFSEIEAFPRAVLEHHYPDVPLHGDFTVLKDEPWIVDADVLVGGTPCQAFSVAGLRKSLGDDRGNLSLEFIRLADSIDAAREAQGRDPSIVVWENVPGVLSVKDNAFGCFLAGLAGDVDPYVPPRGKWTNAGVVDGPQRQVAWRVLDAQYFGLAQRRRRVFVVASARKGFDPAAVLLEFEGVRRDTPPRRETGKGTATSVDAGFDGSGLQHTVGTLCADTHPGAYSGQDAYTGRLVPDVAGTLDARHAGGFQSVQSVQSVQSAASHLVTHALRAEGFDGSEDGTGRGTPLVPVAFSAKDHGADATEDLSPTLRAMPHDASHANGGGQMAVAVPLLEVGKRTGPSSTDDMRAGLGVGEDGDPMYTLQAGAQHGVAAYAFQPRIARNGRGDMGDVVNALTAEAGETGKGDAAPCVAVAGFMRAAGGNAGGIGYAEEQSPTLDTRPDTNAVLQHMAVRRLTHVECERLQGFPDNYTNIPWRGKPEAPDGPRYKALGNSMAVPVMRWIGKRIAEVLS